MKKIMMMLTIVAVLFGVVGCSEEAVKEEPVKEEVVKEEKKEEPTQSQTPEYLMNLMEKHLGNMSDIEYNEDAKAFIITPTDEGLVKEIAMTASGNLPISHWNGLVESMVSVNTAMGGGYSIMMLNPIDTSLTLLVITDGVVVYDAFATSTQIPSDIQKL